jgi:transposase
MPSENTVHIAIELSFSSWLVAARLTGAKKSRLHRIEGGDTGALLALIAELRSRALTELGGAAEVACCFEAGRDGFWLYRLLTAHGILVYVLEPTSILVNRRSRRAKTDRLDAEGMLRVLAAWLGGDRQVCSMVRVPTPEEEDGKRPHRERERLVQEKLRIENRIEALLFTQGIRARPSLRSWERELTELRTGDGRTLPPLLRAELDRLRRRLVLILEMVRELEAERAAALAAAPDEAMAQKITSLQRVRGIGANFSAVLVREVPTVPSQTAVSLPVMSAWHPCPSRAEAWTETGALAAQAMRGHVPPLSSSPGCGCATSLAARSLLGSASALAPCRGARAASPSSPWRGSC